MKYFKNAQNELFVNPIVSNHAGLTEITEQEFNDQLAINNAPTPPTAEQLLYQRRFTGVDFNGVMCSGFKEDQWGLASVRDFITAGNDIDYQFENGNVVTLTSTNLASFEAIWIPFRQTCLSVNFTVS